MAARSGGDAGRSRSDAVATPTAPGTITRAKKGTASVNDLIDTTEMYLRTVFELEEEGIVPLRARIAERLNQSGPTVSQTVARMQRDGLLVVSDDRHLELTDLGRERAIAVMRKHRLAERLLLDVIGLDWQDVHVEACRWEHVMSEQVEQRLITLLGHPQTSPYGNPIPGLSHLGESAGPVTETHRDLIGADVAAGRGGRYEVRRIIEIVQNQPQVMDRLHRGGVVPGAVLEFSVRGDALVVDGRRHHHRAVARTSRTASTCGPLPDPSQSQRPWPDTTAAPGAASCRSGHCHHC